MNTLLNSPYFIWTIAAASILGVIIRPFKLPEAVWVVLGALVLCCSGRLPWTEALHAIGKGTDVYLFLTGMMMASELARKEGLFDFLAALAARKAAGSATRPSDHIAVKTANCYITSFYDSDIWIVVNVPSGISCWLLFQHDLMRGDTHEMALAGRGDL